MGIERRIEVQDVLSQRPESIALMWQHEALEGLIRNPIQDAVHAYNEKGYDTTDLDKLVEKGHLLYQMEDWNRLLVNICKINAGLRVLNQLDISKQRAKSTAFEMFRSYLPEPHEFPEYDLQSPDYHRRVLGGWLGKCAGLAVGGVPLEGRTRREILEAHGYVDYYLTEPDPINDDTVYQVVLLHALEEHGADLTSVDLALEWVEHIPIELTFTAERLAIANLIQGVMPPDSAQLDNPFNEWIGAQMRGEIAGLLFPAYPERAVRYAYIDGSISHVFEGICGEVFSASLISAAFAIQDPLELIRVALKYVPSKSRYFKAVSHMLDLCVSSRSCEEAWSRIEEHYGKYHWIHCLPNIGAVIVALLFGELDFSNSLAMAVMCGLDTDCNAGQVGAILGVLLGEDGIPDKWKIPLGDSFENYAVDFNDLTISDFAHRTCQLGRKFHRHFLVTDCSRNTD